MPSRIEDYALIGDGQTAALVARDGSVDWLCWPRFDAPACFAALLGTREHGRWQIAPAGDTVQVRRRYREGTLILETDFDTPTGSVTLVDFMPLRNGWSELIRVVIGKSGSVDMKMDMALRFDTQIASIQTESDAALKAIQGISQTVGDVEEVAASIASAIEQQSSAIGDISVNIQHAATRTEQVSHNLRHMSDRVSANGVAPILKYLSSDPSSEIDPTVVDSVRSKTTLSAKPKTLNAIWSSAATA